MALPDGGLGEDCFLSLSLSAAEISDFAGQVGNMEGSMALGDSAKYSESRASSHVMRLLKEGKKNGFTVVSTEV